MADTTTASLDDIKTSGSDFTFTGKLAEFAVNADWLDGYLAVSDGSADRNDYSTMWEMLSAGAEESGNRIYREIKSYIDRIGNVDTCGLRALKNLADTIGFKDDLVDAELSFPSEVLGLVEIFSVNTAYLLNKADDLDALVLSNSILSEGTAERFGDAIRDRDSYKSFVSGVLYNTIYKFLTLKVGKFDDGKTSDYDKEIWRSNIARFTTDLWSGDVTPDESVFELKNSLGVGKSFTEKIYADKVIAGEASLSDFSYEEQKVISAEIESRKTRYSDAGQMRYYFMRLYKVLEYFRFVSLTYRKTYDLGEYDMDANRFVVNDVSEDFSLVRNNYTDYEIDKSVVHRVADWIADYCINLSYARTRLKRQTQRNMMKGTKRLIVDSIREFVLEQIDSATWQNFNNSVLFAGGLNRDFDVSLIEYTDSAEYFNIESETDVVDPQTNGLNQRFWSKYGDSARAFGKDEVLRFYNRVFGDRKRYTENDENGTGGADNLYEFLKLLFESGATTALNSDYFTVSRTLTADSGTTTTESATGGVSERAAAVLEKFSGDPDVSDSFYLNIKNSFHPSYQIHPFVQGFEEYNAAYTSIMNLVNSFSDDIETSIARLSDRIDKTGCTINFWYNWNEDFTGYSTGFEKGGSDSDSKISQDSPFNFDALQEFITFPDEYILNILQGINPYYKSDLTGKSLISDAEVSLEISRLQKYRQDIMDVSGKAIYRYAKDFYGNIYVLYKDEADRNNRNALGNIWVRLKNHPIAFPLFDVNESNTPFSEVSCISDSDNERLIRLLKTVVRRFSADYGLGSGYIDPSGLTLAFETKAVSALVVTDSDGNPVKGVETTVEKSAVRANLRCVEIGNSKIAEAVDDVGVKRFATLSTEMSSTEYFVDSVNGTPVNASFSVSAASGGETYVAANAYGRVCCAPTSSYLKATYEDDVFTVSRNGGGPSYSPMLSYVTFADYDDSSVADPGVVYSYTNEYGIVHPCSKRRITINGVYNVPADTTGTAGMYLSGEVGESGDVDFGRWRDEGEEKTVRTTSKAVVDGADVYEDFDCYTYTYELSSGSEKTSASYRYHTEKGAHDIVMVGGCNPFYVKRTANGDSTTSIELVPASRLEDGEPDTYVFKNRAYHNIVGSVILTSFPLSDVQFRTNDRVDGVFDTIHQFQTKSNQYVNYYPYTRIAGTPTEDISAIEASVPSGCITFYDGDYDTVGRKFYYNLYGGTAYHKSTEISAKILTYETMSVVATSRSARLGGSMSLHTNDSSKFPVTLAFNGKTDSNVGTFSTYYGSNEYQKFFDMGFSYDHKMMFMAYRDGDDEYENSGVLIGTVKEKENADETVDLTIYRDSGNNIEGVEPENIRYYHQMDEKFEYFRQDCLSGEPYNVLATQIPLVNGAAMTFKSLNAKIDEGNSWQSVFMETSATDFDALTGLPETDTRMAYSTLTAITGLVEDSIDYRTYVDGIKAVHLGDAVSKNGIYSAFGSFNERDRVLNMTVYLFMSGRTVTANFSIPLKFEPYCFEGDGRGRLSTKLSCTDKRLYLSFASKVPDADTVILNGINGDVNGGYGSTEFASVSALYGDSTITILSFNIEDRDSIEQEADETRYAFEGTELGFFPQFGGLDGKNLLFRSASLSGKTEFPFEVAFDPIGLNDDTRMTRTVKIVPYPGLGTYAAREELAKFINLDNEFSQSSAAASRGLLLTKDGDYALYVPFAKRAFDDSSYTNALVNVGGRKIYDASRPHVNANTGLVDGTVVFADGENGSTYVGALVDPDNTLSQVARILPVACSGDYGFRTDFRQIEDVDGRVFAMHADGKTVSELEIGYWGDGVSIPKNGLASHTLTSSTEVGEYDIRTAGWKYGKAVVPSEGYNGFSNDAYAKYAYATFPHSNYGNQCTYIDLFNFEETGDIYQISTSLSEADAKVAFIGTSAFLCKKLSDDYSASWFEMERIDRAKGYYDSGSSTAEFDIMPAYQRITAFEDTLAHFGGDRSNPASKLFSTNTQRVYRIDFSERGGSLNVEKCFETYTFDKPVADGILPGGDESDVYGGKQNGTEVCMGHSENHILFAYYSAEMDAHGMVYSRKTTPDSVGEYCSFVDDEGNAVKVNRIVKILSMGTTVVAEDDGGDATSILVSTDDGVTFVRHEALRGCNITLVGCGQYGFYGRAPNGMLVRSSDGVDWRQDATVPYSSWSSVNADGAQYLLCTGDGYTKNSNLKLTDRYLEIRQQTTVESGRTYNTMAVDNGVIALASCDDVRLPIAIARASEDSLADMETIVFDSARGTSFVNSCGFENDLFLSPDSSEKVVRIDRAFDLSATPTCKYIDTSDVGSVDKGSYGGFLEINGKLLMYPKTAGDVLVYNTPGDKFLEFYPVDNPLGMADCDGVYVEGDDAHEVVLTPSVIASDGSLDLVVTNFEDRNNYGMVEIDDGFPILVEYSTTVPDGGKPVTQFRFTMMADANRRTVTITTVPDIADERQKAAYEKKSSVNVAYTVGSRTMIYSFRTVDDRPRYVISKGIDVDTERYDANYLRIRFALNDFNRTAETSAAAAGLTYRRVGDAAISVYDDFSDDAYVQVLSAKGGYAPITKFGDYVFTDTVAISGEFETLSPSLKRQVMDCNLSFGGSAKVRDCSGMFDGCSDAEMTESLSLGSDFGSECVTAADRMFRDCGSATIPSVSIGGSGLVSCESMFENCVNATLAGADVPHLAKNIWSMYKNCRSASFDSLGPIPDMANMGSAFYGCESGSFSKASFSVIEDFGNDSCAANGYDTSYMFYLCGNLNAQLLSFDRISPYVKTADRMFYGAGRNSSVMFDDTSLVFARLNSADRMFMNSNFAFDNTYVQFHGTYGILHEDDVSFSIKNDMTLRGVESFFEGTKYAVKAPTVVLASRDIPVSDMDYALDMPLTGHYGDPSSGHSGVYWNYNWHHSSAVVVGGGITGFGSLYKDSSIKSVDLRGIANNADLDQSFIVRGAQFGVQDFSSMCEGCGSLTDIVGYIPPYGNNYSSMFRNCSSLSLDLSKVLKKHAIVDGEWKAVCAYESGSLEGYYADDISRMFEGCASIYSSDGRLDLAMIVERCAETIGGWDRQCYKYGESKDPLDYPESFANAFGNTVPVIFRSGMEELGSLVFDADAAASQRNGIKYATTEALERGYGLSTVYARLVFPNGFLRYCGTLRTDPTRYIAVIYYPEKDQYGNTLSLSPKRIGRSVGLSPEGFADEYNVLQTGGISTWYGYEYDSLYAAGVFDVATGSLLKYAYVGEYDLVKHEYVVSGGRSVRADSVTRVGATVFSGLENTIEPLE